MKTVALLFVAALVVGCSGGAPVKPTDDDVVGMWVMTRLDSSSEDYLAKSGASVDRKKTHNFHIRKNGTIRVTALPVDLAQGRAAIFDASGKWRLVAPASSGRRWQLLLLLEEPKRGLSYDFYKDEAGLFLRGHFDPEDLGVIEFRQER